MHDAWILKIALIKGTAYFDSNRLLSTDNMIQMWLEHQLTALLS